MSRNCKESAFVLEKDGWRESAQVELLASKVSDDSSVRFVVEGETHELFEVRFHRINHRGDASSSSFDVGQQEIQGAEEEMG